MLINRYLLFTNMIKLTTVVLLASLSFAAAVPGNKTKKCDQESVSEVSGSLAWQGFCVGDMIFYDNFDDLQLNRWTHENWQPGNVNGEFQQYVNSRDNSYVQDSILHIKVTADSNPVKSARMHSRDSFNFKYGIVEIRAKFPAGDWLWPAMWLMPKDSHYGGWPISGEIDLVEGKGNRQLTQNGANQGVEHVGSTLHFGPSAGQDAWSKATWGKSSSNPNFADGFHTYKLEWTKEHIKFIIDDQTLGTVTPGEHGFWEIRGFQGTNPWGHGKASNFPMAPFDQQFYIILNVAVGGTNGYFSDSASNPSPKPWKNGDGNARTEFWNARSSWLPTWDGDNAHLRVDYVKVFAI